MTAVFRDFPQVFLASTLEVASLVLRVSLSHYSGHTSVCSSALGRWSLSNLPTCEVGLYLFLYVTSHASLCFRQRSIVSALIWL